MAEYLIAHGAKVNTATADRWTPLRIAIEYDLLIDFPMIFSMDMHIPERKKVVDLLIAHNAEITESFCEGERTIQQ